MKMIKRALLQLIQQADDFVYLILLECERNAMPTSVKVFVDDFHLYSPYAGRTRLSRCRISGSDSSGLPVARSMVSLAV